MAYTSLSNIIEPKVFAQYVAEAVTAKSALIQSGAVMRSDVLNQYCGGPGKTTDLPNFSEFTWAAPDIAKDDNTAAAINSVASADQIAQKDFVSKTWGTTALTNGVSGTDVLGHIVNNVVAPYWVQTFQQYALAKLSGVIKDNVANDSGDMVKNVANDVNSAVAAAESANVSNIVEAIQTMGDARGKISLIVMHSRIYSNLLKLEPGNFGPQSATSAFRKYLDMDVIVDDSLPAVAGTYRTTYTTYLLGAGALAMGESEPDLGSVGVETNHTHGNGYGAETLTSRKKFILHPQGFVSSATVSSNFGSPTITAYDAASAWNRVYSRKNIPIVALKTNA